jgi:tRNA(fMet)-specific endonuclease VapC
MLSAEGSAMLKPIPDPVLVLDTDHLTELGYASDAGLRLSTRLEQADQPVVIAIISAEERLRGMLARLNQVKKASELELGYRSLGQLVTFLAGFSTLPFDAGAAARFARLRKDGVRVATMDLRIACIALEHDAVLLTRNTVDFSKVPGLRCEDWLV